MSVARLAPVMLFISIQLMDRCVNNVSPLNDTIPILVFFSSLSTAILFVYIVGLGFGLITVITNNARSYLLGLCCLSIIL